MTQFGGGHDIELVGDGDLAFCKRCHGGEIELEVPCITRLHERVQQLEHVVSQRDKKITILKIQIETLRVTIDRWVGKAYDNEVRIGSTLTGKRPRR